MYVYDVKNLLETLKVHSRVYYTFTQIKNSFLFAVENVFKQLSIIFQFFFYLSNPNFSWKTGERWRKTVNATIFAVKTNKFNRFVKQHDNKHYIILSDCFFFLLYLN